MSLTNSQQIGKLALLLTNMRKIAVAGWQYNCHPNNVAAAGRQCKVSPIGKTGMLLTNTHSVRKHAGTAPNRQAGRLHHKGRARRPNGFLAQVL